MKQSRFLCIHGHFYQPPRENPWLESVEVQDSAHPYHDWNERITKECYGTNAHARISTWDAQILDIRNNYSKISFNFGPTLLQWLEENNPEAYAQILEADRLSIKDRNGHGNAMAQSFNHTILPLATAKEKQIQVIWGIEDFQYRFNRDPEGMWLPETAADLETLDVLAANGIKFTVLAPRQAKRFRDLKDTVGWTDVDGGRIDPTRPYVCTLPSGRSIVLFFYDGPISQGVAFEGLLNDGNHFAHRLMEGFSESRKWDQLLSIATDGESYGHHHKHGEMALAYAIHVIEREGWAQITNFGEYLSMVTPQTEAQIWDKSSWSCVHGVERWRNDCGCQTGGKMEWNQQWRKPLRKAFRKLADRAMEVYYKEAPAIFHDEDLAIYEYIHVILKRTPKNVDQFLKANLSSNQPTLEPQKPLQLMEIVRNAQLIFTSCAWFFDEISGLESVQNLKYAGRLIQLLRPFDASIEHDFLELLRDAPSNIDKFSDGGDVYRHLVEPSIIDLPRVIAHHCICTIQEEDNGTHDVFCYQLTVRDAVVESLGHVIMKICNVRAVSMIDGESTEAVALVLHHGGSDFRCSMTGAISIHRHDTMTDELVRCFYHGTVTELIRLIDEYFGRGYYTLDDIFNEGKRDLLKQLTIDSFRRFDDSITIIFEDNRKFMDYLLEVGAPLPQHFLSAADFVLKTRLIEQLDAFLNNGNDPQGMIDVAEDIRRYGVYLHDSSVPRKFESALRKVFRQLALEPSVQLATVAISLLDVIDILSMKVDLQEMETLIFAIVHRRPLPAFLSRSGPRIMDNSESVIYTLETLATRLNVSLEPISRSLGSPSATISLGGSSEQLMRMKGL